MLSLVARKVCRHLHVSVLNHIMHFKEKKYFRSGLTLKVLKRTLFSSYLSKLFFFTEIEVEIFRIFQLEFVIEKLVKAKVNFTLEQAMKAQKRSRCTLLLFI